METVERRVTSLPLCRKDIERLNDVNGEVREMLADGDFTANISYLGAWTNLMAGAKHIMSNLAWLGA